MPGLDTKKLEAELGQIEAKLRSLKIQRNKLEKRKGELEVLLRK